MTKYPKALWLPISRNYTNRRRTRTRGVILHVDAGNARTLRGWFNNASAGASSHFHVQTDGGVEQYVDTDLIAWTSGEGSSTTIGVETQGYGEGSWTAAQCEAISQLLAWCNRTYGVPLRLMASSKSSETGVGWHRLGVDGNFPAGQLGGRTQRGGGESWSKSRGKSCPGDDRIKQIPGIVERAKQIVAGTSTPATPATPAPATSTAEPVRVLQQPVQTSGATQLAQIQAGWKSNLRPPVSDVSNLEAYMRRVFWALAEHEPYVYEDNVRDRVDYDGHGQITGDSYHYRFQPLWFVRAKDSRGLAFASDLNFRRDEQAGIEKAKTMARQCGIAYNDEGDHLHLDCGPYVSTDGGDTWTTPSWVGRPTIGYLRVDGEWGPATNRMLNYLAYGQADSAFNSFTVWRWQAALNKSGAGLAVDGQFGPSTQAAVMASLGTKLPLTHRWAVGLLQQRLNLGMLG